MKKNKYILLFFIIVFIISTVTISYYSIEYFTESENNDEPVTKNDQVTNNNDTVSYKYSLSILVICKNEEMVIDEFVKHYKWQGVEHIYLIDNGSTDNMIVVLAPYIIDGYISYFSLPEQHKQVHHYNTIYNIIRNDTKWLILCDSDEYIYNTTPGETIVSYLKNINHDICLITLPWKMFGSSGHIDQPQEIRKSFTWRKLDLHPLQKCIVQTKNILSLGVHDHICVENTNIINNPHELSLNHYAIMSEEYFKKVKITRGDVVFSDSHFQTLRDMNYFNAYDYKEIHDDQLKNLLSQE